MGKKKRSLATISPEVGLCQRTSLPSGQGEQLDIPSLNIASRAVEYQKSPPESFDSTWMLTCK
jgi:hypothetical protein